MWSLFSLMLIPSHVTRANLFVLFPVDSFLFLFSSFVLVPVRGFLKCLVTFHSYIRARHLVWFYGHSVCVCVWWRCVGEQLTSSRWSPVQLFGGVPPSVSVCQYLSALWLFPLGLTVSPVRSPWFPCREGWLGALQIPTCLLGVRLGKGLGMFTQSLCMWPGEICLLPAMGVGYS